MLQEAELWLQLQNLIETSMFVIEVLKKQTKPYHKKVQNTKKSQM